jgi:cobalt transporter subunit CbtB
LTELQYPPGLFRALVLAAPAISGLQMIRAALSWALASRLWQGRTGAIRLLTVTVCAYLFSGGALMKALLAGMQAQAGASSVAAVGSRSERLAAAAVAALLGLGVIWGVGFSHVEAWHNAAHDTRHSMEFPCH